MRRVPVKSVRGLPKLVPQGKRLDARQSKLFVFCEKSTGLAGFRAESKADPNGELERMAGLLAIQCLVRGSDPEDFAILVAAETVFTNRLVSRAKELLEEGRAAASPVSLSPRQTEILRAVICNRANKEIASRLNISVRTVKFHISSLLSKFRAENRAELARRATGFLRPKMLRAEDLDAEEFASDHRRNDLECLEVISDHRQASAGVQ
jgi:DNA-binding CsgD family transcriptional regulator